MDIVLAVMARRFIMKPIFCLLNKIILAILVLFRGSTPEAPRADPFTSSDSCFRSPVKIIVLPLIVVLINGYYILSCKCVTGSPL